MMMMIRTRMRMRKMMRMRMILKEAEGELGVPDSCSQPVTFYISRAQKFYATHIFPRMMMRMRRRMRRMMIVIYFTCDYDDG